MNHRHQNRGRQIQIVRRFCENLADARQRTVCFFLSRDTPSPEICRRMNITPAMLEAVKLQIAVGLRQAGIVFKGEELSCPSN